MKTFKLLSTLILLLWLSNITCGQPGDASNISRIENNQAILRFDLSWSKTRLVEIAGAYGIDSVSILQIRENIEIPDTLSWRIQYFSDHIVELSKPLDQLNGKGNQNHDILLLEDAMIGEPPIMPEESAFGYNDPKCKSVYTDFEGNTTIYLEGYKNANYVFLSGSFNHWSTLKDSMKMTDKGWIINLKLPAGKHLYKFIVDGRWTHDKANKFKEDDGQGGWNSIFYVSNFRFVLPQHEKAKKVFLAGSFNSWSINEIPFNRIEGGWELPVYLKDGTYAYKYIVDKEWITDPTNVDVRLDALGNQNSFVSFGKAFHFELKGQQNAKQVILAGSFNNWSENELVMKKSAQGWELDYVLPSGNYEYKFIVDGNWMLDLANPFRNGSGDFVNSFISIDPNHSFQLSGFRTAKSVLVTGSFNAWQTSGYQLLSSEDGWILPLYLKPGKYLYKFIVDDKYLLDPQNPNWEENELGTGNSVLWVE